MGMPTELDRAVSPGWTVLALTLPLLLGIGCSDDDSGPAAMDLGASDGAIEGADASPAADGGGDRDGDGTPDDLDGCPDDGTKTEAGLCGCGTPEGTCDEPVPQTLVLAPGADAHVDSANPTSNYGLEPTLLIDGAPDSYEAMLRFDVPTLTAPLQRAVLRLFVTDPSPDGPAVHVTTNDWTEEGVTWESRPSPVGDAVANAGDVANGWLELDVTTAIAGEGEISFLLVPEADDGADFDSRQGTNAPELVVVTDVPPEPGEGIEHVGTTESYDSNGQDVVVERPAESAEGDLLILILHRTDDDLPLFVDGWTRVAECFKGDNGDDCGTEATCTAWHDDDFCAAFADAGNGHDLAQSVFFRVVGASEPSSYSFDLNRDTTGPPGWAILIALRGAASTDPVRDWAGVGCDADENSVFPSVLGETGDMVLLSQSFDDAIASENFTAPPGTELLGYVSESDEAGFLFGGILEASGETGDLETGGPGGPGCKDALVSLTVVPR